MKLTEDTLKTIIKDYIMETFGDMASNEQYPGGYALIDDADQALIGNYSCDDLQAAIEDAKKMAEANPYGSYRVCGADENNQYDYDETCVFSTFDEGKHRIGKYIKENIKSLLHTVIKEEQDKSALDSDYFKPNTDPNTPEGYLKLLFATFMLDDGMNANDALKKAKQIVQEKYGTLL
jgi:hypothetical protein